MLALIVDSRFYKRAFYWLREDLKQEKLRGKLEEDADKLLAAFTKEIMLNSLKAAREQKNRGGW